MFRVPGYEVWQKIYEGQKIVIYNGIRLNDGVPVFLKLLNSEYPDLSDVAKLKNEYELNQKIHSNNVIEVYSMENYEKTPVLILEDFGGETLFEILDKNKKFNLIDFLDIAIQLSQALIDIYDSKIIHKVICPNNIMINMESKIVKLIDFANASFFSQQQDTIDIPADWKNMLNFISPEQTGRMNRKIDYRTDFYSLGITFYQMLTGSLPFKADDTLGLIHCHLAIQPIYPHIINSDIPEAISNIIMKLVEKMPENRYQSAIGLKWDLEKCKESIENISLITDFQLGQKDVSDLFKIPNKLYGRKKEIEVLKSSFERVSKNKKEIIMVTGCSGIGKSRLVNTFRSLVKKQSGYFISGKFDQFEHDIPYSALIYSFKDLVQQILRENKETVQVWRDKLLDSLGTSGEIIINVIPEIELIIGKQPKIIDISSEKNKTRFFNVFKDFVKTFCEVQHPLVIFLDDLQWADQSCLKLIQILISDSKINNVFFIGSYRNNEIHKMHPLQLTLNDIQKENIVVNTISLKPLKHIDIQKLVLETFQLDLLESNLLSEIIQKKTAGNPFFISQFLYSLYKENLIWFNEKKWNFDLQGIRNANITDNVVELITTRISKFPKDTVQVLKLAACIGNQFDLDTLSLICKKSFKDTYSDLCIAIKEGIILPTINSYNSVSKLDNPSPNNYTFLHDRIQQAAYSLIEDEHRKEIHLKIGRLMLSGTDGNLQEGKILDIVNQLNLGIELVYDPSEKEHIAKLELLAGKIAKNSTAYDIAYKYLITGMSLIEINGWERSYELTHSLYVEAAEIAYLIGDFELVEKYTGIALNNSKTVLDKVKLYEIKIIAYTAQNKKLEVVNTALFVLKLLGINFPNNPNMLQVLMSFTKTKLTLIGKQPDSLYELPQMTNPYLSAALNIMINMGMPTYMLFPNLFLLIILKAVRLYIKHGNSNGSPTVYATYGMLLCYIGDIDSGYKFGNLSLRLLDKFHGNEYRAQTIVLFNTFINPWKMSARSTLTEFIRAYSIGLETGNINYVCTSTCLYSIYAYYSGENLVTLEKNVSEYSEVMRKFKNKEALITQSIFQQSILNLIGFDKNSHYLKGKVYDEDKMMHVHLKSKDRGTLCNVYLNKSILSYIFGEYDTALDNSILAEKYLDGVSATLSVPVFYFYNSLIMLSIFDQHQSLFREKQILYKVSANQQKMKKWARYAECNFLHKFYLIEAEKSKVLGKISKAITFYEKAIKLASKNDYIQEEALANELAAKFYLSLENKRIAKAYMEQAVYCYTLWGAASKVNQLKELYPQILNFYRTDETAIESAAITSENKIPDSSILLDTATIMKATHAISSEIKLEELLKKLIYIVLENAGAQKVCYLSKKEEKYVIQAEGSVDGNKIDVMGEIDFEHNESLPKKIIYYVNRSLDSVILDNASTSEQYIYDQYIIQKKPKSIMCMPVLSKGNLLGILYLENNLLEGAFNNERIQILKIISSQLAISLENATLYANLERSEKQIRHHHDQLEKLVEERTSKLREEIMERKKAEKLLKEMATHDNLTGLPNRKLFQYKLKSSLELAKKNHLLLGILFVDLDGFKKINDNFGHDSGDIVLKTIAERLLRSVRKSDMVSRFGGDEFIIIMEHLENTNTIVDTCKRIISEVARTIIIGNNEGNVTASIGVAVYPTDGDQMNKLMKKADDAMYRAKRSGKNRVVFN